MLHFIPEAPYLDVWGAGNHIILCTTADPRPRLLIVDKVKPHYIYPWWSKIPLGFLTWSEPKSMHLTIYLTDPWTHDDYSFLHIPLYEVPYPITTEESSAEAGGFRALSTWALLESPCRCVLENRTLYLCPRCFVLKKEGLAYGPGPYEASREVNPISPCDFKEPAP